MSELKGQYGLEMKDYWYCKTDGHITPFNPPCHCLECGTHIKTMDELKPATPTIKSQPKLKAKETQL